MESLSEFRNRGRGQNIDEGGVVHFVGILFVLLCCSVALNVYFLSRMSFASGSESNRNRINTSTVPSAAQTTPSSDLQELLGQARAVPFKRNGQTVGVRLFAIRSGSAFEEAGFKNGDVVLKVNGVKLKDPSELLILVEHFWKETK